MNRLISFALPLLLFLLILVIASSVFDDYGGYTDELVEIQTSVVNVKYVFSKIPWLKDKSGLNLPIYNDFATIPELQTYKDRTYGTTVMLPTILVSDLFNKPVSLSNLLKIRRIYVFLNFYLALICFYFLLKVRFKNELISLSGVVMLTLTPRFFAESFYNCKDIIFFSWFMISFCALGFYSFGKEKLGTVLFVFAFGLTVNSRFYGLILLPAFWYMVILKNGIRKSIRQLTLVTLLSFAWIFVLSPYLWEFNWKQIISGLTFVTNLPGVGDAELFMGRLIAPRDVWYYLPVWMGITIPILYLVLFFIGAISIFTQKTSQDVRFAWLSLMILLGSMAAIILSRATIYHGWRHAYFLYAPLIYLSVCGLEFLWGILVPSAIGRRVKKGILICCLGLSFISTGSWMFDNHPFDFVYFNEIGRRYAHQFTRDYWGVASKSCLLYLNSAVQDETIRVGINADLTYGAAEFSLMRLPESIRDRFEPIWQTKHADYLCFSYKNTPGNEHEIPEFEVMKTFMVDGYAVEGVYRRVEPAE